MAAAFDALERFLDAVDAERAGARAIPGEWTVHEVVDHLLETHRPGLDELRRLLAGQRPPGAPIPAGLQSMAPLLRPWPWLGEELRRLHAEIARTLRAVPADFATDARAPLVMVVAVDDGRGGTRPLGRGARLEGLCDRVAPARDRASRPGAEGAGGRRGS